MTERVIYVTGATGAQGPPGPQGPQGEKGDPGADGSGFVYSPSSPSSTWVVTHNLHKYPVVQYFTDDGEIQDADVVHNSIDSATLTFPGPTTGKAVFS